MDKGWQSGTWLLLDAAGPETVFGLVHDGDWLDYTITKNPFLERCQVSLGRLLKDHELGLEELSGILFASGPGSTLGLRLAALFARSLLQLPGLEHWRCAQYNNLAMAVASLIDKGEEFPIQAIAPWRRDRVHRVSIRDTSSLEFISDSLHPDELDTDTSNLFPLGNRPRNLPPVKKIRKYPVGDLLEIMSKYPQLIEYPLEPTPYSAESPEFALWSSKRHSSK